MALGMGKSLSRVYAPSVALVWSVSHYFVAVLERSSIGLGNIVDRSREAAAKSGHRGRKPRRVATRPPTVDSC